MIIFTDAMDPSQHARDVRSGGIIIFTDDLDIYNVAVAEGRPAT
jgi:hypothetical protein